MLSLELRISQGLRGYAEVVRQFISDDDIGFYNVKYYRMGREPPYMEFKIVHKRTEGAEKLALLVFREIDKRLKKTNDTKKE